MTRRPPRPRKSEARRPADRPLVDRPLADRPLAGRRLLVDLGLHGPESHATGRHGERLAAQLLRRSRLRIVARNLHTRHGEIDLLARRRRLYVAVEVKTRRGSAPERALTSEQRDRTCRALKALAPVLRPRPRALRVDLIAVRLDRGPTPAPEGALVDDPEGAAELLWIRGDAIRITAGFSNPL